MYVHYLLVLMFTFKLSEANRLERILSGKNKQLKNLERRYDKRLNDLDNLLKFQLEEKHIFNGSIEKWGRILKSDRQRWMKSFDKTVTKRNSALKKFAASVDRMASPGVRLMNDEIKKLEKAGDEIKKKTEEKVSSENTEKTKTVEDLQKDFLKLSEQIQRDQFYEEFKHRSDGKSGLKQIRSRHVGGRNYYEKSYTGFSIAAIHNHANNIRTIGMGEFIGVLNGVEFRTRHNDYRLFKPLTNDKRYHKTENVEFPEVPEEVLKAGKKECANVAGATRRACEIEYETQEMRAWFKAWLDEDTSVRNYTRYFKPVLTYLEAAWTTSEGGKIDEPFESDRHHIDAESWLDLQEKIRYTSYEGSKSLLENLSHLPTKIVRFTDEGAPVLAQWNYRILCHPIQRPLSFQKLKLIKEPSAQVPYRYDDKRHFESRGARFDIEGINLNHERDDRPLTYNYLDAIMAEVPGKDNYGAHIDGQALNQPDAELFSANPEKKAEKLNTAYYHRSYLQKEGDKTFLRQVGFNDRVYTAQTTQSNIAQVEYTLDNGETVQMSSTYAVPVEIIYLTPLQRWNPYGITYNEKQQPTKEGGSEKDASEFAASRNYFITPESFYSGVADKDADAADTSKDVHYMQTPLGVKMTRASGVNVFLPDIPGVGRLRTRWPVMPIFSEGETESKLLNALEDVLHEPKPLPSDSRTYETGISNNYKVSTAHDHQVTISIKDYDDLMSGEIESLKVETSSVNQHVHVVTVSVRHHSDGKKTLFMSDCDGDWMRDNVNHPNQVCKDYHVDQLLEKK